MVKSKVYSSFTSKKQDRQTDQKGAKIIDFPKKSQSQSAEQINILNYSAEEWDAINGQIKESLAV